MLKVFLIIALAAAPAVALCMAGGESPVSIPSNRQEPQQRESRPNMIGAYGSWLADKVLGSGPASLSFRTGKWKNLDSWRSVARQRVLERIAPVDLGRAPQVRVEFQGTYDGLHVERLSWQLPAGPRTEAVFLKPAGSSERLPAILAL